MSLTETNNKHYKFRWIAYANNLKISLEGPDEMIIQEITGNGNRKYEVGIKVLKEKGSPKREKGRRFYCPSTLLFSCVQPPVKNSSNNNQSIKAWNQACSFFLSFKKYFPPLPGGCPHSSRSSDFMTGLALLFSPNRTADEQQMLF